MRARLVPPVRANCEKHGIAPPVISTSARGAWRCVHCRALQWVAWQPAAVGPTITVACGDCGGLFMGCGMRPPHVAPVWYGDQRRRRAVDADGYVDDHDGDHDDGSGDGDGHGLFHAAMPTVGNSPPEEVKSGPPELPEWPPHPLYPPPPPTRPAPTPHTPTPPTPSCPAKFDST